MTLKLPSPRARTRAARIPTSNARTAYTLLRDVCTLILREPRKLWMATYANECGTHACVAGWVCLLARPIYRETPRAACGDAAVEILLGQLRKSPGAAPVVRMQEELFEIFYSVSSQHPPGSAAEARRVVELVRAFMAEHEEHLRAVKL